MYQIDVDKDRNLLRIQFSGRVKEAETKESAKKIAEVVPQLRPGFNLLTDLSGLESMELACAPHVERSMDLCNERGVAKVARVIPDPTKDIGWNIMSLFHYRPGIPIVTCATSEEAVKVLSR